jgi:hypothetical protein
MSDSPPVPPASLEDRVAALEAAVQALTARVERLGSTFDIVSDVVRFGPLQDLLLAGRFTEADRETVRVLYDCINSSAEEITPEMIETFPATSLGIVDRLWRQASGGRFGFSVQLGIYRGLGGTLDSLIAQDVALYRAFCQRVGWSDDGRLIDPDDSPEAGPVEPSPDTLPLGALPRRFWITPYGMKAADLLLARLITAGFEAGGDAAAAPAPADGPTG